MSKTPTYTATWDKDGSVIYKNQPHGNLFGQLPYGSLFKKFPGSIEDEWDGAQFGLDEGTLTVRRDQREARP